MLGYRALASLTDSEARLAAEAQRWRDLDALFARLEADMRAALPRDVRTGAATEPAWVGDVDDAGNARAPLLARRPRIRARAGSAGQRIGYRLRDGAVEVLYWPHLDQPAGVAPQPMRWRAASRAFRVAYLDARGAWRDRWPVLGEPACRARSASR